MLRACNRNSFRATTVVVLKLSSSTRGGSAIRRLGMSDLESRNCSIVRTVRTIGIAPQTKTGHHALLDEAASKG